MSKGRELTLLEKWADATGATLSSPISPTSPKATKFCCCPQRRRYHIKPSIKSTLDARNIFVDNDFTYIDDVPLELQSQNRSNSNTNSNTNTNNDSWLHSNVAAVDEATTNELVDNSLDSLGVIVTQQQEEAQQQQWQHDKSCHFCGKHSGISNSDTKANEQHSNTSCCCSCLAEPAQYQKNEKSTTPTTIANNCNNTNTKLTSDNDSVATQQQRTQQPENNDSNEAINECRSKNSNNNNYKNTSTNSDQQIQRLSNSEFNCSNIKQQRNNIYSNDSITQTCNCALDSSSSKTTTHKCCNSSESQQHVNNDDVDVVDAVDNANDKIDLQNKMTITTTNVASRKRGECGLTSAAAATAATAETTTSTALEAAAMTMPTIKATTTTTLPPTTAVTAKSTTTPSPTASPTPPSATATTKTSRPTTPSLTTVIKTTLVKRSPSNESTTKTTETTPLNSPVGKDANTAIVTAILAKHKGQPENVLRNGNSNNNNTSNSISNCDETNEPTRTVKQRIAALVAAKEQARNHDNSIKSAKFQCNSNNNNNNNNSCNNSDSSKHQSNMTTQAAKSAINSVHYNQPLISSSKCPTTLTTTTTTTTTATATTAAPSNSADLALTRHKSPLNDAQRASLPATGATGYATMPRRRSPAERHGNAVRCGSITAAMTADKKLLNDGCDASGAHKLPNGDTHGATDTCRKLVSTLDNLDLALNRDLTDDDAEDSYTAFQEYLERVEHEINEVFEMRKAQKLLQQQKADSLTPEPHNACNDEFSPAIESDSGCYSGSGSASGTSSSQPFSSSSSNSVSDSGSNGATAAAAAQQRVSVEHTPTTIKLKALPPPPVNPNDSATPAHSATTALKRRPHVQHGSKANAAANSDATNEDVNVWANKFLRDLDNLMSSTRPLSLSACSSPTSKTSPLLLSAAATAAIQSRYGKCAAAEPETANGLVLRPEKHTTIPLQSFNLDCGHRDNVGGNSNSSNNNNSSTKPTIAYMRTLSAPTPYHQQLLLDSKSGERNSLAAFSATMPPHQPHYHNLTNLQHSDAAATTAPPTAATILKIEETAATSGKCPPRDMDEDALKSRRQRQLDSDMEATMRSAVRLSPSQSQSSSRSNGSDKSMLVTGSCLATSLPKRERINHATATTAPATQATKMLSTTTTSNAVLLPSTLVTSSKANGGGTSATTAVTAAAAAGSTLLNGSDAAKKGSTSTIWTSEESILRSVGAVDEDNNSTSSSACEEASGVLSSGKSGISLDSSGLDNDNNESGIGTATPPKDISYWKNAHNDTESVSSFDALRKMKFQKSNSVASSDDPDLLEVLSLCDEPQGVEDIDDHVHESQQDDIEERQQQQQQQQQPLIQRQQQQQQSAEKQQQKAAPRLSRHRPRVRQRPADNRIIGIETDEIDLDEEDEGHDEFEMVPFYDCDCNDGDASSASGSGRSGSINTSEASAVLLRRKLNGTPLFVPPKCRSHSLDTASLPIAYNQHYPQLHAQAQLTRKLHHLQNRTKERGQLSLTLRQEPFTALLSPTQFNELPSPSSASLHSGHESLGIQELTTKSNSAPLLLKQEKKRDDFAGQKSALRYSRSQSDRYLAEIEAIESCKWLRAAGFPQYAQMYEDHQFPIDLASVAKDHTNLENDQLQSLYRRLCILNRCANMRIDQSHKTQTPQKEDSDDENFALSENWTFQPHIRRWSRVGEMGLEIPPAGKLNIEKTESSSKESSPDRFDDDQYDIGSGGLSLTLTGDNTDTALNESGDGSGVRLRRTGSERFKDGAKAFLRRVESIKSRRRKRQHREGMVISGPQALDLSQLGQRSSMRKPEGVYSTPPSPSAVSPMHTFPKGPMFGNELKVPSQSENFLSPNRASPKRTPTTPRSMRTSPLHFFSNPMPHLREGKSDDSSSYYSDSQESSTGGKLSLRKTPSKTRRFLQRTGKVDDIGAHSDSECHQGRKLLIKDANSNTTEVKIKKLTRGGSLNLGKDPKKREGFRTASFRSRSTSRKENKGEETETFKRTPVVRWHSFQMEERPHMIFRKCFSQKIDQSSKDQGVQFAAMSAGQLQILRKLALVILTGHMENYCPSHRSGWNWELPKFIKKIKMPDYKDKKVFGVPLLLVLQRTGQAMPMAIRAAFRWLQVRALDQVGLFRKSGVKSRIMKLKSEIENLDSTAQCMEIFDTQQAYDVADMLKQYFRDLPESLLTTKMSETFATIFQHLPKNVRLEAVQCAVLLLPDENREILYALLEFLTLVAANAEYNQMTANNLAVCLAPSLFHTSISTSAVSVSASPRRRKGAGVPDDKELLEAKASHECLAFMIENYKQIYTASKEKISRCNFGYMEESKPVPLEALGEGMQFHNWRGYLYECTSATIKEGREKTRGWFTVTSLTDNYVDIAYKKVGDGHPLRLWRCITEVEGPPKEVMDYIIKQRASWDPNLLESQTVKKLDERTEIFQYAVDGQFTTDFCVLRSWQTDLPRGACVIVETSIDHAKAKPMFGAVRGVVLASRYLIEPCGSGRSRVMHLARVDIKGRSPEWYNRSFGHICSHYLSRIRLAFKNVTEGPESKV